MNLNPLRPAIAMIELIFALVIMGITLLSAPLILNMSIESSNTAMQQESIAVAATELSLILTHPWDEGDSNGTTGYGILQVSNGDSELDIGNRLSFDSNATLYDRRFNTAIQEQNASLPATFGNGNDVIRGNDIDDFDGATRTVRIYAGEASNLADNEGEYLKGNNFTLTSSISYGDDTATYSASSVSFNTPFSTKSGSTNIKLIRVTLSDSTGQQEHNQSITLYGFACNIGNARIRPVEID